MRVLRFPDLRKSKGISFSRMHIDRLEKAGKFPRRLRIGSNSVAWVECEVDEWLQEQAEKRVKQI